MRELNEQRRLMEELVDDALVKRILFTTHLKPGEIIKSLSVREREILSALKSADIQDVRWPRLSSGIKVMPSRTR